MPDQVVPPGFAPFNNMYYNSSSDATGTNQNAGTNAQQNLYGAGQQQLQGLIPSLYANSLQGGNIPQGFYQPQPVLDAWNSEFKNNIQPGLVAQYGAGSPQIASRYALGTQSLLANLYQQGMGNYNNQMAGASNYALTPIGGNQQSNANQNWQTATDFNSNTSNNLLGSIIGALLGGLL